VTGSDRLERRYRRLLGWYPEAFRREYEDEILGVLLGGARDGQRRPGAMDSLDLAMNGLSMRLRPESPRPERALLGLPVLLYVGALMELAAGLTILATTSSVQSNLAGGNPGLTDAHWRTLVASQLEAVALAACLAAAGWLGLGWAIRRGHGWAKIAFGFFLGFNLFGLVDGLAQGSAAFAPADVVVGAAVCLVQLVVVVRTFSWPSGSVRVLRAVADRIARPLFG
jgi:hypothetical protein